VRSVGDEDLHGGSAAGARRGELSGAGRGLADSRSRPPEFGREREATRPRTFGVGEQPRSFGPGGDRDAAGPRSLELGSEREALGPRTSDFGRGRDRDAARPRTADPDLDHDAARLRTADPARESGRPRTADPTRETSRARSQGDDGLLRDLAPDLAPDLDEELADDLADEFEEVSLDHAIHDDSAERPLPQAPANRITDLLPGATLRPPAPPSNGAAAAAPDSPAAELPSGDGFARELRRKMTLMAERLFRGQGDAARPVDLAPAHDHQTEIDLASLGVEPAPRGPGEPLDPFIAAETYVASGSPLAPPPHVAAEPSPGSHEGSRPRVDAHTGPQTGPHTGESGEVRRPDSDAPALIARMFDSQFTGRVVFRRSPVEKSILFDAGRPVFATSNLPHDRMGDLLYREGKITSEQHQRSRELVAESGRRMGEILVERGFIKRRELLPAVRRHVEDIIYSLFAWEGGEYAVTPGDFAAAERIRLARHPAGIVVEGIRRKLTLDVLGRLLGGPTAIVEIADRDRLGAIARAADLTAEERGAIDRFDGDRAVGAIPVPGGIDLLSTYQLAHSLIVLGAARVRRSAADDSADTGDDEPALLGETDLAIDRQRLLAKHALVGEADYFTLLGVRRDATSFEIRRAYESARRDYGTEAFAAEVRRELTGEIDEIAAMLDEAYDVLRDDGMRGAYLANLRD
jgi:hypothetical protein